MPIGGFCFFGRRKQARKRPQWAWIPKSKALSCFCFLQTGFVWLYGLQGKEETMPRRYLARNEEQGPKMPLASAIRAAGSREFWVITLTNLLVMTSCYLVFVVTAAYVRETWHTSLSVTGLAVGVMIMGCLVGRFVSGNLVSLLGCRKGSVRPCQPLFSGLWHSHIASRPLAGRIFDRCGENVLPVPIFCLMPWHSFFLPRRTAERCCFFRGCSLGLALATSSPWARQYHLPW